MTQRPNQAPFDENYSPLRPGDKTSGAEASVVQARERSWSVVICFFLAVAVWIVFGQTLHHGFVNYDDDAYVYENPVIMRGPTVDGIIRVFTHSHANNWHPLTSISHMLDCQLFGLKPGAHHLTNVLLHAATAIILFLVLRNMTRCLWPSAFVAAVFAVHPLRAESVAWISERKDVLSGLFFVLTVGAYVRYARRPFAVGRYLVVLLLFTLGLLSKPMFVTVPFVLLLLDYWPLQRMTGGTSLRSLLREKIPFLLLTAGSCVATILAQDRAIGTLKEFDLSTRITNALVAYATYLGQIFYPVNLAVFYPHPEHQLALWTVGVPRWCC